MLKKEDNILPTLRFFSRKFAKGKIRAAKNIAKVMGINMEPPKYSPAMIKKTRIRELFTFFKVRDLTIIGFKSNYGNKR